jgi:hypothetical protein
MLFLRIWCQMRRKTPNQIEIGLELSCYFYFGLPEQFLLSYFL